MKKVLFLAISISLLVTGCGSSNNTKDEAQNLIIKGCKAYNLNYLKPTFEYATFFSKLAISDPAYIEIARAAGVLMATKDNLSNLAEPVKQSWVDSRGLLDGFCASVK
jgi:hypothetical protein